MASDDNRSVAADSWSIKSDYGSTLDDEQRYADTAEVLLSAASVAAPSASVAISPSSDFSFDKDVPDTSDVEPPILGLRMRNFQDGTYAEDVANFHERSHADDRHGSPCNLDQKFCSCKDLPSCSILDIGTGSGRLLQQLVKQGFSDLTGINYIKRAIELAHNLAIRYGFEHINFLASQSVEHRTFTSRYMFIWHALAVLVLLQEFRV